MIRNDFVSNSSSASYIIIPRMAQGYELDPITTSVKSSNVLNIQLPDPDIGKVHFGRAIERVSRFYDKLNFCGLQLLYLYIIESERFGRRKKTFVDSMYKRNKYITKFAEYYKMLKNVCLKYNIKVTLNTHCLDESKYIPFRLGYIDHSSSVDENKGMDMFESEKKLHDFLFNRYSFIQIIDDNNDESFSIIGDLRKKGLIP